MSQPMMDYEAGYCNYDCIICGEVCPTGAILKRSVDEETDTDRESEIQ